MSVDHSKAHEEGSHTLLTLNVPSFLLVASHGTVWQWSSIKGTVCCPALCGRLKIAQRHGHLVTTLHCKNMVGKTEGDKVSFLGSGSSDNGQTMKDFMVMDSFDCHRPHPESPLGYF